MDESGAPHRDLARVDQVNDRLLSALDGVAEQDRDPRRPTSLPGWTVGHLLTHVARNADSHVRRAEGALHGKVVDQYPGGPEGREMEIAAGAGRDWDAIVEDVRASGARLQATWEALPQQAWDRATRDVQGRERPLRDLPARRWQELEIHLVDLDIGATHRDWPDDFVAAFLPRLREFQRDGLVGFTRPEGFDDRDELAWLLGRLSRPGLPPLRPWV